ncbi:hypothetical protein BBJ28_00004889 [Nothophytophthora sp. Chile5]|nr:hypothetical protein BBJ28_00004889 [Nothophytophthora sp. Chile5]
MPMQTQSETKSSTAGAKVECHKTQTHGFRVLSDAPIPAILSDRRPMAKKAAEQLTSIEHGAFDTAALQQELAQALEDDRLYKLTDNAKKRAIHTAANYDEFKADMDADLMAEIIHVLVLSWRQEPAASDPLEPEQAAFALQMMQALTQTSRFSLILDFLDNHQLDKAHDLFRLMERGGGPPAKQQQEMLISLKAKFRIAQ